MDKQWVSIEQHQCPACGKLHDTGSILLNKFMRNSFPGKYTCTGLSFCSDCQKYIDDGYVILIEVDNKPSGSSKNMKVEEAKRTGRICYLKKDAAREMFGMETEMAFIEPEVFEILEKLQQQAVPEKEHA